MAWYTATMLRAVILDLDGTMIDSEALQSKSLEMLLRRYGKTPQYRENGLIQIVGLKAKDNISLLQELQRLPGDLNSLVEERRRYYRQLLEEEGITVMPGVQEVITLAKKHGLKTAVASNSHKNTIITILKKIGLFDEFDVIVGADDVERTKPFPDMYFKTAQLLGVNPSECLVFEDTETGVTAAKDADMYVIAVPSPYTQHHDFSRADKVIDSLKYVTWESLETLFSGLFISS